MTTDWLLLMSTLPPPDEYIVVITKLDVVRACEGFRIEPALTVIVELPSNELVSRLLMVRVRGADIVQVGVVDTLVPLALRQVCVEAAREY